MDTVLISVTGVALALAAGMGVLLARMMREERRRSDARVQVLEELAAKNTSARTDRRRQGSGKSAEAFGAKTDVVRDMDRPTPVAQDFSPASAPSSAMPDLPLRDTARPVAMQDLFHEEPEPSPWPRRFAVIGALAAVLAVAILGWTPVRVTGTPPAEAAQAGTAAAPALELLSLRHSREGATLTVTGLVQNPKGAATLSNVQATLFVFGPGGTFLTSARVPLDFTSLTPGDESPFVIRVPVTGEVARYRVGFRGPDDRVVGHVDRRSDQLGRNNF